MSHDGAHCMTGALPWPPSLCACGAALQVAELIAGLSDIGCTRTTGEDQTVCVVSNSFDANGAAASLQASGDLPVVEVVKVRRTTSGFPCCRRAEMMSTGFSIDDSLPVDGRILGDLSTFYGLSWTSFGVLLRSTSVSYDTVVENSVEGAHSHAAAAQVGAPPPRAYTTGSSAASLSTNRR